MRGIQSIPPLILIIVTMELTPVPAMMLNTIRFEISHGSILRAVGLFVAMVFVGLILFVIAMIAAGILNIIWGDNEDEDNQQV